MPGIIAAARRARAGRAYFVSRRTPTPIAKADALRVNSVVMIRSLEWG
jgi:hypothetical protein